MQVERQGASQLLQQPIAAGSLKRQKVAAPRRYKTIVMAAQNVASVQGTMFIREHLKKLAAYTPIEPFEVLSAKLGRQPQDIVKLDANENPYGPPPEVLQALGSMEFPNIYPDPESRRLRKALAEWQGVPMEHLLVSMRKTRSA